MARQAPHILVTGDFDHPWLQPVLADTLPSAGFVTWGSLLAELEPDSIAESFQSVDLLVIAQVRRGQFQQTHLDRLRRQIPLAAIVVVYGPWCEGETRSGQPLKDVPRVPIGSWPLAAGQFFEQFDRQGVSQWHQPSSRTEVERLVESTPAASPISGPARPPLVQVVSVDHSLLECLAELAEREGWQLAGIAGQPVAGPVDALLIDCYYRIEEACRTARAWTVPPPVVALLGFARPADREVLRNVSARSIVLDKPCSNQHIRDGIRSVLSAPAEVTGQALRLARGTG